MAVNDAERRLQRILEEDEQIRFRAEVIDALVAVTDRRLAIADEFRLMIDAPFVGLRRIQFDIERQRPATLVVVPESWRQSPVVLAVPPEQYDSVAHVLAHIGHQIVDSSPERGDAWSPERGEA